MKMSIRALIIAGSAAIALGFGVVVITSNIALSTLKVGGPLFLQLKSDYDLLADILPPPEYVLEPYLEATLAMRDGASVADTRSHIAALHKAYSDRKAYWAAQPLDARTRSLLSNSLSSADRFWNTLEGKLVPALSHHDRKAADAAYRDLTAAYAGHRAQIDRLVANENDSLDSHQKTADRKEGAFSIAVWTVSALVLLMIAGAIAGLMLWVLSPLLKMTAATKELAEGNLDTDIPALGRSDELGELAGSIGHFRTAALDARVRAASEREKALADQKKADQIAAMASQIADGFGELSNGNLAVRLDRAFPAEFERLRDNFNNTVAKLERNIAEERSKADATARAVTDLGGGLGRLANGDLKVRLENAFAAEFEQLRRDFNQTVTTLENNIVAERRMAEETAKTVAGVAAGLKQLSNGQLNSRLSLSVPKEYEVLKTDFNATASRLEETITSVTQAIGGINTGAGEISQASDDLSRRTEQQAASLEQTAAALEEITATIRKTAQNAQGATKIVTAARLAAEEGGNIVEAATGAMGQIEKSSHQITEIIGVIDEIAFQTNLLALNAGVEAARAGDSGRGFAVVASEVRALAQRSGEAARQIKSLIKTSSEQVAAGVTLVGNSGEALRNIAGQVMEIDRLVSEMAMAAQQQSTGVDEVNTAVAQMDSVTQQNAAMVEESTAAARNLATETDGLARLVAFFKVGDHGRKPSMRRAA